MAALYPTMAAPMVYMVISCAWSQCTEVIITDSSMSSSGALSHGDHLDLPYPHMFMRPYRLFSVTLRVLGNRFLVQIAQHGFA